MMRLRSLALCWWSLLSAWSGLCQKLDFGFWIFGFGVGSALMIMFVFFCFPFLFLSPISWFFFSSLVLMIFHGTVYKKWFEQSVRVDALASLAGQTESTKGEISRLANPSDRTGWILWFHFVCVYDCYLLLGSGSVRCVVGRTVRWMCLGWTGRAWTGSAGLHHLG